MNAIVINKTIPTRTYREWTDDNKDIIKKKQKEYRINNINKIKKLKQQQYQDNKDKLLKKATEYREDNKDKIKQYFNDNKDILNAKKREKITCICGSKTSKASKSNQDKIKKHIAFITKTN